MVCVYLTFYNFYNTYFFRTLGYTVLREHSTTPQKLTVFAGSDGQVKNPESNCKKGKSVQKKKIYLNNLLQLIQHAGDLLVTGPYGFHFGFNIDNCINEAVNFACPGYLYRAGRMRDVCYFFIFLYLYILLFYSIPPGAYWECNPVTRPARERPHPASPGRETNSWWGTWKPTWPTWKDFKRWRRGTRWQNRGPWRKDIKRREQRHSGDITPSDPRLRLIFLFYKNKNYF